ncbi:ribonuclease H-like domain-containing protein [Tanacetum coccineum]
MSQSTYDDGRATSDVAPLQLFENRTITQIKEISLSEGNISESPTGSLIATHRLINDPIDSQQTEPRRNRRVSKLPAKLNDYIIDNKLRHGLEKHVHYAKLIFVNYYFATTLNKSVEPSTYYEDALNSKWIEAMNDEIAALYRNNTWIVTDLSKGRKDDFVEDVHMTMPMGVDDNNCNEVFTRKSISGFVVMIGRCLVSWKSKKHPTISKSLTEDEYKCLVASTCEIASNPVFHE